MKTSYDRKTAKKAKDYVAFLAFINNLRKAGLYTPPELVCIDGVYILVRIGQEYLMTVGPITKVYTDSNGFGDDATIYIYPDFFRLKKPDCQMFLLAHDIGRYKTGSVNIPQYGIDKMKRDYLKVGKVVDSEIKADRYASTKIIGAPSAMMDIADYIESNMNWDEGALEMRLRSLTLQASNK